MSTNRNGYEPATDGGRVYFLPLPLSFFCDISRSYLRIIAKFSVPSKPSSLHVLTKGKLASFDTSAQWHIQ